ncbi:MAG: pilus assembly protein [Deltaproteobacteria bacterium]|nr:MAG: pilus assembly protein [Deltaproteobacteria bacterium]
MLKKIRGFFKNKKGFTLIELMIVIAIIGILAAIAIPQFAKYRTRAYNAAALSDLKNFQTEMESQYSDNQEYPK